MNQQHFILFPFFPVTLLIGISHRIWNVARCSRICNLSNNLTFDFVFFLFSQTDFCASTHRILNLIRFIWHMAFFASIGQFLWMEYDDWTKWVNERMNIWKFKCANLKRLYELRKMELKQNRTPTIYNLNSNSSEHRLYCAMMTHKIMCDCKRIKLMFQQTETYFTTLTYIFAIYSFF